jgi:hypothetical protein
VRGGYGEDALVRTLSSCQDLIGCSGGIQGGYGGYGVSALVRTLGDSGGVRGRFEGGMGGYGRGTGRVRGGFSCQDLAVL